MKNIGGAKETRVPVVIGGDNLPSPVGIGLTDLPNMGGGGQGPPLGLASLRFCDIFALIIFALINCCFRVNVCALHKINEHFL